MAELLAHGNDRVVRAMSGALRNLAIDNRNCELLGKDVGYIIIHIIYCTLSLVSTVGRWRCIVVPGRTWLLDLFFSCRFARSAPPCGQLAWRPESVGAHAVRGDRRVCTEHARRGSGQQSGGSKDPPSLAGHREAGAYQQGRVSVFCKVSSHIGVRYDLETDPDCLTASKEHTTSAAYRTNNPDSARVRALLTASAQIVRCGGRARCCSSSGPTKSCVDLSRRTAGRRQTSW